MTEDFDPGQTRPDTQNCVAGVEPSTTRGQSRDDAQPSFAAGGSIYDLIAENCKRFSNSDELTVARRVIADGKIRPADLVLPLVYNAVWNYRRAETRAAETTAVRKTRGTGRPVRVIRDNSTADDDLAIFLSLLDKPLRVDGQRVLWGDATVAQHKLRAEMFTGQIAGMERTRDLHLRAVFTCESHGVDSLRPLFAANRRKGTA